ncbi:MAG: GGDEF domain-containing protein, partial [Mariprofundaceae bacterium]
HSHQPLSQWFGKDTCVAALYFDLDGFKGINDRLGHTVGDDLLVQVCDCTRQFIRNQDPLIRMGGDEFVVLLPGCSRDKAGEIAKRIVQASAEIHAQDEKIAISMGIAFVASGQDMAVKDLIESADKAMYVAKALGGDRYEFAPDGANGG